MTLDRTDLGILSCCKQCEPVQQGVAAAIGLAPSSAHERFKRLRDEGVLRGAHADVAPKAMGVGLEAIFFIELSKHEKGVVNRFLDEVVVIPEVRSAFLVTGPRDFIVHVVARDMQHLKDVVLDRFTNRSEVTRMKSSMIFETRVRHELPLLMEPHK